MRELRARRGVMCKLAGCEHAKARCTSTRGRELRTRKLRALEVTMRELQARRGAMCKLTGCEHERTRCAGTLVRDVRALKGVSREHARRRGREVHAHDV